MLIYEELDKIYGDYPVLSEKDLNKFLESDDLFWFIAYISDEFKYIKESRFCESYYSKTWLPKIHWKNVISIMNSSLKTFELLTTDEFNGEKTYVNTKFIHYVH